MRVGMTRTTGLGIAMAALVALVAVGGATMALGRSPKLLVTNIDWVDTAENSGTWLFQGTVDDGTLAGRAYPGNGSELIVSGTVASDGDVSGTLYDASEQVLGTFSGEMDANGELDGDLVVDGELDCLWDAPADDLPTP